MQGKIASNLQHSLVWWLRFLVLIQATQLQLLGRELRSHFTPPLNTASLRLTSCGQASLFPLGFKTSFFFFSPCIICYPALLKLAPAASLYCSSTVLTSYMPELIFIKRINTQNFTHHKDQVAPRGLSLFLLRYGKSLTLHFSMRPLRPYT